jgi:hypothetical protein
MLRSTNERALLACALWMAAGCAQGGEATTSEDDDGASATAVTSGAGASSASGAGGGSASATGSGGAGECPAPTGTVGIVEGSLVDMTLAWQGYAAGATEPSSIAIGDYYDCDGTRGIDALLITQSALWCAPCQEDALTVQGKLVSEWSGLGIRALELMVEHDADVPATIDTASIWQQSLGLSSIDVAADPDFAFDHFDIDKHIPHSGFPLHLVIDPRSMIIIARADDGMLPLAQLEQLAASNQ